MDRSSQSEVNPLATVLLRHPHEAFSSHDRIDQQWRALHYRRRPNLNAAIREFTALMELLDRCGAQPILLPGREDLTLDSIYVRDAAVVADSGIVLCRMGKAGRRTEPAALQEAVADLDVNILGEISPPGRLEGGDVVWLNPVTLVVGLGYRTNQEGADQLKTLLGSRVDEWIEVSLPHWRGPSDVFHLMSMLSPLDDDLALVYSPLLPVPFRERLLQLGFELVEAPDEEFESMGCNVLTVAPRRCIALESNPLTRRRLEAAGVEVLTYQGREISHAGCGGPTCLTRPLQRRPLRGSRS